MIQRIVAIGFIFASMTIAWIILGQTVRFRTHEQDAKLKNAVGQLWGAAQIQRAPTVYWTAWNFVQHIEDGQSIKRTVEEVRIIPLQSSRLDVDLQLEHRRKGLLWYATYTVAFTGTFTVANETDQTLETRLDFPLPDPQAVYDDFSVVIDGENVSAPAIVSGHLVQPIPLPPGARRTVRISYRSQGLDQWRYRFGDEVNQVSDFALTMHTDFQAIDFPQHSMSPTRKEPLDDGWKLEWRYDHLLTGVDVGMSMPRRLNPGPWTSQVSFAAPISLFLFFFLLFLFCTVRGIGIHPMNYLFVGAAFFSFHLLLAYLVDHISIHLAIAICSAVSIFLVISYMRLVVGLRLALVEVGLAQLIYLVLFSYTFFFEGYTGLAIALLCIVTLFAAMQFTGRLDWGAAFRPETSSAHGRI
jgi:hypothetical protein